jgi:putative ABC transport system permease protein
LIYGVTAQDLPTFSCAVVLLMLIALAASYIPARRPVALDPVAALRRE